MKLLFRDPPFDTTSNIPYLYVFDFNDVIKIGVSIDPERRLKSVETASGRICSKVYAFGPTQYAYGFERQAHIHLGEHRIRGEFFSCSSAHALAELQRINFVEDATEKGFFAVPPQPRSTADHEPTGFDEFIEAIHRERIARVIKEVYAPLAAQIAVHAVVCAVANDPITLAEHAPEIFTPSDEFVRYAEDYLSLRVYPARVSP